VRRRSQEPIETTLELVDVINAAIPAPARFAGGHPARRVFQALRIAVNDELDQLDRALPLAWGVLCAEGVLAGIAFHSLEDRRLKRFLADRARGCICPPEVPLCVCGREPEAMLITRRSIEPSGEEIALNPRASSARLRAARKLAPGQVR
jgi:16S rRNA (cytosine1402-N4)-methyltransferase